MGKYDAKGVVIRTQNLVRRARRVGQRTERVEHCANAELTPRDSAVSHRWMVGGRKQERHSDVAQDIGLACWLDVDLDAQSFEHVGAPRAARDRAISVLCDRNTASCDHECGPG